MTDISIYKAITITHKTSNLKQISDYVVMTGNNDNLQELLHELKDEFGFGELLYLSTCNRVLYLFTTPKKLSQSFTKRFLSAVNPVFKSKSANKRIDEEQDRIKPSWNKECKVHEIPGHNDVKIEEYYDYLT